MEGSMTILLFVIETLLAGIGGYFIGRYSPELLEQFGIRNNFLRILITVFLFLGYGFLLVFLTSIYW
jgi:hypothetical protein